MNPLRSDFIFRCIAVISLSLLPGTALPELITRPIVGLTGIVNPFTYTDSQGTFTTSPISLSLSNSAPSFLTVDSVTGAFTQHVETVISLNDGKPFGGNDLIGTLIFEDAGTSPGFDIPFDATITDAVIQGAGPFDGTTILGRHTHRWRILVHEWNFRSPPPEAFLDLPAGFINGDAVPISGGTVNVSLLSEPSSLALIGLVLLGLVPSFLIGLARRHIAR